MEIAITVDRIKKLAKTRGYKMKFLCSQLGVWENYFNNMKNHGKDLPDEILNKLAIMLDTSVDYLIGKTNDPDFRLDSIGLETMPYEGRGSRPIVGKASAGLGVLAQEEVLGYAPVRSEYDTDNYFWLRVTGDSMYPMIIEGDLVLVQKDAPLETGTTMVVVVDDEKGFIKKVTISDDTVVLHSVNPAYPPMIFGGEEISRLRVVGRVIEQQRRV